MTSENIKAARYDTLLKLHGPAIADILHCEYRHIGLELDDLQEAMDKDKPKELSSIDEFIAKDVLIKVASHDPSMANLSLAAQLFGVGPCSKCGYRQKFCKCVEGANEQT